MARETAYEKKIFKATSSMHAQNKTLYQMEI